MNKKGGFYFGSASKTVNQQIKDKDITLAEYFDHIFKKGIVELQPLGTEGIYGVIFVVKFKTSYLEVVKSNPDLLTIRDYNMNPCERMLLKVCYIDPSIHGIGQENERPIGHGDAIKQMVGIDAFNYEVQTQQHVFNKTNSHLQPITPLIYYNRVYNTALSKEFLEMLYNNSSREAKTKLKGIANLFEQNQNLNLGFIFMEMRDGFGTVNDAVRNDPGLLDNINFLAMTGEVLNRLHNTCRVTHGDLHMGNLLIDTTKPSYYAPDIGNILLIDWGRAKLYERRIQGTQDTPIPVNEAHIELYAADPEWPAYQWLSPRRLQWNSENVNNKCIQLRKFRKKNYTTSKANIPAYFYQPGSFSNWGSGRQEAGNIAVKRGEKYKKRYQNKKSKNNKSKSKNSKRQSKRQSRK